MLLAWSAFFGPGLAAQGVEWTHKEAGLAVMFPSGWERAESGQVLQYSPTAQTAIGGSLHRRRAGGVLRRRYLSAALLHGSVLRTDPPSPSWIQATL